MKKYLKTPRVLRRATLLAMLPVFFLAGCGQKTECEKSIDTAMGTVISQTVYVTGNSATTTNSEINEKITDVLLQKLNDLEQKELSWRLESAEVAWINAAAGGGQTSVSPAMAEWLGRCRQISEESAGAFDVSIGRLSRLWDIDTWAAAGDSGDYELPRQEEIAEALATTGWQKIQLEQQADGDSVSIPAEMQLDLGAVGKGVALDEILKTLEAHPKVSGAVISVGGSILTYGSKPEGGAWQIAVTDPLDPSESVGVLTLDGGHCVSTSGDYERYVEVDGVRYHHILDPRTGSPAHSDVAGVTIVTKDGFLSVNSANGQQRELGFRQTVEQDPRVKDITTINVLSTTEDARAGTKEMLLSDSRINVVVTFNEWTSLGVGWAIRDLDRGDRTQVVAFDSNVVSVGMLETGEVDALIVQNPYAMGYLGVETAANLINGQTGGPSVIDTATTIVTRENMYERESQKILFSFEERK